MTRKSIEEQREEIKKDYTKICKEVTRKEVGRALERLVCKSLEHKIKPNRLQSKGLAKKTYTVIIPYFRRNEK